MSEKKSRVKLSPEEWAEFREAYLKAFETITSRIRASGRCTNICPAIGTPPPHLRKRRSPRRRHGPPMLNSGRRTDD